ncbi:hypothetical protein EYF80_016819 [Liparis tanakae]|uniref:Uncharacterized protein n=1 Tax=Liparis tanakae TaxID=230148 RepID=A0A4Z2I4Y7_9TELE|nr:hypothetical protein EYF80_016819 [Liparis tanakae]
MAAGERERERALLQTTRRTETPDGRGLGWRGGADRGRETRVKLRELLRTLPNLPETKSSRTATFAVNRRASSVVLPVDADGWDTGEAEARVRVCRTTEPNSSKYGQQPAS